MFIQKQWYVVNLVPQWGKTANIILTHVCEFVLSVIIFYLIGYLWEEWKLRKYQQKMRELEGE